MNSRQRRASRRHWRYPVRLKPSTTYETLQDAREWCERNFGIQNYGITWSNINGYIDFFFKRDQDAVVFALTWA